MAYRFWTFEEKVYIAKFYEHDGCVMLADAFDVTYLDIIKCYKRMEKRGKLETYRKYWNMMHGLQVANCV